MSHFSMFVPTQPNVKLANGNTGHAKGIGIILFCIKNCPIVNPVGPVYCHQCHTYNTISLGALKCNFGFKKVMYEPIEHCGLVYSKNRIFLNLSINVLVMFPLSYYNEFQRNCS